MPIGSSIAVLENLRRTGRRLRKPQHTFNLEWRPFQVQPFLIAPVLPGETMKNLQLQARCVTDPILNPLIGWWLEYYIFYVKLRDLDQRDLWLDMLLVPGTDISSQAVADSDDHYHEGSAVNWSAQCLSRVMSCYFRDEGEAALTPAIGNLPAARINNKHWMDSVVEDDVFEDTSTGIDVEIQPAGTEAEQITASEVETALRTWQWARDTGLTDQSYEDFLRTYGVRVPKEELLEPELIRYVREWQYPSNTINASTGAATSAVSWSISERADKDRYFKEPGFIYGVTIARPKVYLRHVQGAGVVLMNHARLWLPAVLRDQTSASWTKVTAGTGPLTGIVDDYWVDIKDLFLHGDQFLNYDPAAQTGKNLMDLPDTDMSPKWYPDSDDVNSLFVASSDPGRRVKADGVVNLSILSALEETSRTEVGQ